MKDEQEQEKKKREDIAKKKVKPKIPACEFLTANIPGSIDNIIYPDPNVPMPIPSAPDLPPPYES